MKQILSWSMVFIVIISLQPAVIAQAQDSTKKIEAGQELALKLANPLVSMISVPFQFNMMVGVGPYNGSQLLTNFQPVIPFKIGKVNIITRTIVPFIENRNVFEQGSTTFGLSDINFSAFITPAKPGKMIWGIGPAITFPTATASYLGAEKWAAGPTMAFLKQTKSGWTYALLARQIWSFAGSKDVDNVSPFYINPGVGHSFKSGAGLGGNFEISGDWNNLSTQVFLNLNGSMVSKFGKQPVSFVIGPRIPMTAETIGDWGLRVGFTLIFKQ
ncbi:MAG TPA: hypothetical protein DCF33_18590 [Saprospirales bacterium]|nr:hypothetical protein [Saprospirales bacterium]